MNISWIKAALIRAAKTVCQTAIAMIGTSVVLSDVAWKVVISAAVLSGILSLLTSLAGLPETAYEAEVLGGENDSATDTEHEADDPEDEEGDA